MTWRHAKTDEQAEWIARDHREKGPHQDRRCRVSARETGDYGNTEGSKGKTSGDGPAGNTCHALLPGRPGGVCLRAWDRLVVIDTFNSSNQLDSRKSLPCENHDAKREKKPPDAACPDSIPSNACAKASTAAVAGPSGAYSVKGTRCRIASTTASSLGTAPP